MPAERDRLRAAVAAAYLLLACFPSTGCHRGMVCLPREGEAGNLHPVGSLTMVRHDQPIGRSAIDRARLISRMRRR